MITFSKLQVLWHSILGYGYKILVDLHLLYVPTLSGKNKLIVSLTSYGRRVANNVVYYTIVSLLRQSVQPSCIILWLSENEWDDNNLPVRLSSLKDKGVEIRFCKDIRSYKKLIPTMRLYPDCDIMTVDDDMIYRKGKLERIIMEHNQNPCSIIAMCASDPIVEDGIPIYYDRWKENTGKTCGKLIFPIGYGGIYYPAGSLHPDVLSENLFMKLCPLADDIWFWFCGILNDTNKVLIQNDQPDLSFDALYQYFHRGSALTHQNRSEHRNDKQFHDLFSYYGVRISITGQLVKL